jgi:predicted nucleic acid-binding protein
VGPLVFLDNNIFIYSVDSSPDRKREADVARELIKRRTRGGTGVISVQVLQEFYQVSTTFSSAFRLSSECGIYRIPR